MIGITDQVAYKLARVSELVVEMHVEGGGLRNGDDVLVTHTCVARDIHVDHLATGNPGCTGLGRLRELETCLLESASALQQCSYHFIRDQ